MGYLQLACFLTLVFFVDNLAAAENKVLLFPVRLGSHIQMFGRLGLALQENGLDVTMVISSKTTKPPWLTAAVKIATYTQHSNVSFDTFGDKDLIPLTLAQSPLKKISILRELTGKFGEILLNECEELLQDADLIDLMKRQKFDFAILDSVAIDCLMINPYKYDIPFGEFGIQFTPFIHQNPTLPSFNPSIVGIYSYSDRMNFWQRLNNFIYNMILYMAIPDRSHLLTKYAPEKPYVSAMDVHKMSSLHFYLDNIVLSYPKPKMPNTISIGDVMAHSEQPLTADMQQFVSESTHGVILFSMGSTFNNVPKALIRRFCDAFAILPQRVIMKHSDADACGLNRNIRVTKWMPQNDLLAHPDVKLFITHGGFNSLIEAIYHRVPIIIIPVAIDQPFNAHVAYTKGYGVRLDIQTFTSDTLVDAINNIINNASIAKKIRVASAILRDASESAGSRAAFLINHVIKHGDGHLKSGAADLSVMEFFMVDIFLFLSAVALLCLIVLVTLCWAFYICMCSKLNRKTKAD